MTRDEFRAIEAYIESMWPNQPISDATGDVWFELLRGENPKAVIEVVRLYAIDGKEFPPTGGQILKRIYDQQAPPEWDEVLAEIRDKLRELNRERRFQDGPIGVIWETPDPGEWRDQVIPDLIARSGGIGAWVQALGSWWPSGRDDTTFLAQQRKIWEAMRARIVEHGRMEAIGATSLQALRHGEPQKLGTAVAGLIEGGPDV